MTNEFIDKWNEDLNTMLSTDKSDLTTGTIDDRKIEFGKFKSFGLPTLKNEEWKYTPLGFINNISFSPVVNRVLQDSQSDYKDYVNSQVYDDKENLLVFINGLFSDKLSSIKTTVQKGLYIGSLANAFEKGLIKKESLGAAYDKTEVPFNHLNDSLFMDGACVIVPDDMTVVETIHLMFIADPFTKQNLINPKNVIVVGENSRIKLVETFHNKSESVAFFNSVTIIRVDRNAIVDYYKFQNERNDLYQIGTTTIEQKAGSVLNSHTITLHGKFVRNNLTTTFHERDCEANFHGLYYLDENNFVDNHTLVDHASPYCNSNEIYKGIMDNKSTAVFNGKIMVRKDARKTNAYQSNKNILLSDDCTINTKPQLEIFNDDVKCSHGATSGSIDEESMFYLRSRGISLPKAKSLLLNAFASQVIDRINIPELRNYIREQILDRLQIDDVFLNDDIENINN